MANLAFKNWNIVFRHLGNLLCLTSALIFLNNTSFAQCKLQKVSDDFSNSQTFASKDVTLASVFPLIGTKKPWDLVMNFILDDTSCTIIVTHQDQASSSNLEYIFFKFTDGSIIKKENPFDAGAYNTGLGYRYSMTGFIITIDELKKFSSVELAKFQASLKYNINYPLVEEDIKQKNSDRIRQDASCILEKYNLISSENLNSKKENKKEVIQYKCEFKSDNVDPFTKQRKVYTSAQLLYDYKVKTNRWWLNVIGNNNDRKNGLQFEFGLGTSQNIVPAKAQEMLSFNKISFLMIDEEVITFSSESKSDFADKNPYYICYLLFPIDDSTWEKLKSTTIKTIRISLDEKVLLTMEVEEKFSNSVSNVINCINSLGIIVPK